MQYIEPSQKRFYPTTNHYFQIKYFFLFQQALCLYLYLSLYICITYYILYMYTGIIFYIYIYRYICIYILDIYHIYRYVDIQIYRYTKFECLFLKCHKIMRRHLFKINYISIKFYETSRECWKQKVIYIYIYNIMHICNIYILNI